MGTQTFTVQIDDYVAKRLDTIAGERQINVTSLVAEALDLLVALEDQPDHPQDWSPEDLAAIREGLEQLERGEGVSQDEVEREVEELLRS